MRPTTVGATWAFRLLFFGTLALAAAGCTTGAGTSPTAVPTSSPIPPASKVVFNGSYAKNIQPIFTQHCVSCHGPTQAANGLRLDSYEGVMKGTQYGAVVVPGSPTTSALESVVIGTASPEIRMPHGGQRLTDQEVQNITLWIQAGAPK